MMYLRNLTWHRHFRSWQSIAVFCSALGLYGCQFQDLEPSSTPPAKPALGEACSAAINRAINLYDQGSLELAAESLIYSKQAICVQQYELARVEQFLASVYYGLDELTLSLETLSRALERNTLDAGLQSKSLYFAAQLSYMADDYQRSLRFLDEYTSLTAEILPPAQVLRARCLSAMGQKEEAVNIMLSLYARHKNGEIEMREEWLNFLRGIQLEQGAAFG